MLYITILLHTTILLYSTILLYITILLHNIILQNTTILFITQLSIALLQTILTILTTNHNDPRIAILHPLIHKNLLLTYPTNLYIKKSLNNPFIPTLHTMNDSISFTNKIPIVNILSILTNQKHHYQIFSLFLPINQLHSLSTHNPSHKLSLLKDHNFRKITNLTILLATQKSLKKHYKYHYI